MSQLRSYIIKRGIILMCISWNGIYESAKVICN